jgi:hypothetical protein
MITGIKEKEHVFADYSYVPLVLLAPALAGFEKDKASARICRSFAFAALGVSLLTDAPWGALKVVPYKTHAAIDLGTGLLSLALITVKPISKNKQAKNTMLAMSAVGIVVGILSLIGSKHSK